jgi:hypothetical protein
MKLITQKIITIITIMLKKQIQYIFSSTMSSLSKHRPQKQINKLVISI